MNTVSLVSSSIDKSMLFILIVAINKAFSIRIGFISNATYIPSYMNETFVNMTCMQCTCAAFMYSAIGWNWNTNNNTCQLINNYTLNDIGLIKSVNSTFLFQQLPPEPLSIAMNVMTTETTTIKTTVTSTISMDLENDYNSLSAFLCIISRNCSHLYQQKDSIHSFIKSN
jgi:hypothetical protein